MLGNVKINPKRFYHLIVNVLKEKLASRNNVPPNTREKYFSILFIYFFCAFMQNEIYIKNQDRKIITQHGIP